MGADLIISAVAMRRDREEDQEGARRWIDRQTYASLAARKDSCYEVETLLEDAEEAANTEADRDEAVRAALRSLLDEWNAAPSWRDVGQLTFGEWNILLTGGMSWGDDPTESFGTFERLIGTGLATVLGYGWPEPSDA